MSDAQKTEVLVIGAGPGGYPAAFHAADLGLKVTLVDPEVHPGGVCLYCGCVPSKALLHVAAFLHEAEQAAQWGVTVGPPQIDLDRLREWKNSVVRKLTGGLGQLVKQRKIQYVRGTASLKDPHRAAIQERDGPQWELAFDHAIVATGSLPATLPGIPESPRVMNSRQALDLETIPGKLLVVGGGYIGMELGQLYAALGSKVTLVEMLPDILPMVDRDLMRFLSQRIEGQFERILPGTKFTTMAETERGLQVAFEGAHALEDTFDKVMVSVGRKPLTQGVGLENVAATLTDRGFIEVDGQRRTAEPSIFAVGDVAGQPMLAHKATAEARVAVAAIAGKKTVFDPRAIPFVVFSDPEIAGCGLTEAEAKRQGIPVKVATFPWAASGRALTLSRTDGLTKLICDPDSGRILGAGFAGKGAGELLAEAVLAMEMGAVADDLALAIHTHPTLSETIMEAAQAFSGRSTHFNRS